MDVITSGHVPSDRVPAYSQSKRLWDRDGAGGTRSSQQGRVRHVPHDRKRWAETKRKRCGHRLEPAIGCDHNFASRVSSEFCGHAALDALR